MARTQGAVGKARYVEVSMDTLAKTFGPNARIHVSIEHHGAMLGVDRNSAPRVKSLRLEDGAVPVAAVTPVQSIAVTPVTPVTPVPEVKEEPAGFKVDFSNVD